MDDQLFRNSYNKCQKSINNETYMSKASVLRQLVIKDLSDPKNYNKIRALGLFKLIYCYMDEGKDGNKLRFIKFNIEEDVKALDLRSLGISIKKLVNNIIENVTEKPWRSYILSFKDGVIVIAGGKTQGIMIGDNFNIFKKGQIVTNPQTGMKIELPGELIGKVIITQIMGNNINDEISIAEGLSSEIDISNLKNYYIEEITNN